MPLPIVGGLIAVVGAGIAKALAIETIKMVAIQAILYTLFTLILPVVLYNVFTRIMQEMMELASDEVAAGGMEAVVLQLTGMGGWLAENLQMPAAMALIMSAVGLSFVLKMLGR